MATTRGYSGKEFTVRLGIQDVSATNLGTQPADNTHILTPVVYRLNGLSDIAWDAGYSRAELSRSGQRLKRSNDIISHYGSGTWTWDFDWTMDNEVGIQNLLNLIYPSNANGADHANGFVVNAAPTVDSMKHGQDGATNSVANIIIKNPNGDEDRFMHSAVLQTLTLSMDAGTHGGVMGVSGQFMSGYNPGLGNYDTLMASPDETSVFQRGLFDFTSTAQVGGHDASVKSISITLSNPATRTGFQGASGETDGYSRGGDFDITGNIVIKADDNAMENLDEWIAGTPNAIALTNGSDWTISMPSCVMGGHAMDLANEGVFVDIPFTATSGPAAGAVPFTFKCT